MLSSSILRMAASVESMDSRRSCRSLDEEVVALLLFEELLLGHEVDGLEPLDGVAELFEFLLRLLVGEFEDRPELLEDATGFWGDPFFGRGPRFLGSFLFLGEGRFFFGFLDALFRGRGGCCGRGCPQGRLGLHIGPEFGQGLLELPPAGLLEVDQVAIDFGLVDLGLDSGVLRRFLLLPEGLEHPLEIILLLPDLPETRLLLLEGLLADAALGFVALRFLREAEDVFGQARFFGLSRPDLLLQGSDLGLGGLLATGQALDLLTEAVHLLFEDITAGLELEEPPFVRRCPSPGPRPVPFGRPRSAR